MENTDKNESKSLSLRNIYNIISIICITISMLIRLFTPGLGLIVLIMFFGPIHIVIFFISNYNLFKFVNKSLIANLLFWLSCITFTMVYVFFPESGDAPGQWALFGLITDPSVIDIFYVITKYSLYTNLLLLFLGVFIFPIINAIIKKHDKYKQDKLNGNNENILKFLLKNISTVFFIFCIILIILKLILLLYKYII